LYDTLGNTSALYNFIYSKTGTEMERYLTFLVGGIWVSVQAAAGALILATLLGLVLALMLLSRYTLIFYIARTWVEIIRGTPALAQLFILYFGLADFGLRMPPLVAAIAGLGINGSAYLSEIFRSGIQAVDHGQTEAARSLGLSPFWLNYDVVLPQAGRIMVPPFVNYGVQLLKDTSLIASIAAPEIMFRARNLVMETYDSMTIYLLVAALYLCISIPLSQLASFLQTRSRKASQ
jgi:His/Glu/Gln/Arg/opine family amino acid ABC transporter permease subunit